MDAGYSDGVNPDATDYLGNPRVEGDAIDLGAVEGALESPAGRVYIVTSLDDTIAANDGVLTFAEAFLAANTNQPTGDAPGGSSSETDVIRFAGDLAGTIAVDAGPLTVLGDLRIEGPGAEALTFDAEGESRVFIVHAGAKAAFSGLTITGGRADSGGGVWNAGGLTMMNVVIAGNRAVTDAGRGAGIFSVGPLELVQTVFSANVAAGEWAEGPAVYGDGSLDIAFCTFAGNHAPDARNVAATGRISMHDSLFGQNEGDPVDGTCADDYTLQNNLVGIDPRFVRAPSAGPDEMWGTEDDDFGDLRLTGASPAIDVGGAAETATDAAGNSREYGTAVDIGAYECQQAVSVIRETPSVCVTIAEDSFDLSDGTISLREAIYYAGTLVGETTITFVDTLDGARMLLDGSSLWIDKGLTIDASGLDSLIVDAQWNNRVFFVANQDGTVRFTGLTITGGDVRDGAGILNVGSLDLADVRVLGNADPVAMAGTLYVIPPMDGPANRGGGIYNGGSLTVTNGLIVGNEATAGGGIYNTGSLDVRSSTIVGNEASLYAGTAIGSMSTGGDGIFYTGTNHGTNLENTIVAGNGSKSRDDVCTDLDSSDPDFESGITLSYSFVGGVNTKVTFEAGSTGYVCGARWDPIDPRFASSPSRGADLIWGTEDDVLDLSLAPDSPAINAGNAALLPPDAWDLDGDGDTSEPLPVDAAGNPRVAHRFVDMGAFEYNEPWSQPGDANGDYRVTTEDMTLVRANWGRAVTPGNAAAGDLSGDGKVNSVDLDLVRTHFGKGAAFPPASALGFSTANEPSEDTSDEDENPMRPAAVDLILAGLS